MKFKAALSPDNDERRSGRRRRKLRLSIELKASDGRSVRVGVRNIADQGMLLESDNSIMALGDIIEVELLETGSLSAEIIWAAPPYFGCRLDTRLSSAQIAAALLRAEPISYRLTQGGEPVAAGEVTKVSEDPVPNFTKAFLLMGAFWALVAAGMLFVR